MKKENSLVLFAIILFTFMFMVGGVLGAASGVNLKITGTIGDYTDDVRLRTDSSSTINLDSYDMLERTSPSGGASFYSLITGGSLAIDSWDEADRNDIELYYDVPSGVSGNVVFSWNDISGSTYTSSMTISGEVINMVSDSDNAYTYSATDGESIYIVIDIGTPASPTTPTTTAPSGGGGGGGGAAPTTVTQPPINIIYGLTPNKLLFDVEMVISDEFHSIFEGDKMQSSINLIPMGVNPNLDVFLTYTIKNLQGKEFPVGKGETIKITGQESLDEIFNTAMLPPGDYVLELELKYDSDPSDATKFEFAYASSQFRVEAREAVEEGGILIFLSNYKIILLALGIGMIVLIILIIVVITKTKRPRRRR